MVSQCQSTQREPVVRFQYKAVVIGRDCSFLITALAEDITQNSINGPGSKGWVIRKGSAVALLFVSFGCLSEKGYGFYGFAFGEPDQSVSDL